MTHLTVEDAGSVRRYIFQFIHHRVKGDLAWCLLVNNGHPELFLKFICNLIFFSEIIIIISILIIFVTWHS